MDIEQLKLILDVISDVGDGAFIIGLLWILKGYFSGVLFSAVVLIIAYWTIRAVRFINAREQFFNEIRPVVKILMKDSSWHEAYVGDLSAFSKWIRERSTNGSTNERTIP